MLEVGSLPFLVIQFGLGAEQLIGPLSAELRRSGQLSNGILDRGEARHDGDVGVSRPVAQKFFSAFAAAQQAGVGHPGPGRGRRGPAVHPRQEPDDLALDPGTRIARTDAAFYEIVVGSCVFIVFKEEIFQPFIHPRTSNFLDEAMKCYKDGVDRRMSIVAVSVEHYGYGRFTRIRR